jgi:hypothetical protein
VKYAHLLFFHFTTQPSRSDTGLLNNRIINNDLFALAHNSGDVNQRKITKGEDYEAKIMLMINHYYNFPVMNSIICFNRFYKNTFKFYNWYNNYARNIDIVILFERAYKTDTSYVNYITFNVKPRYEVPYYNDLIYSIQYYLSGGTASISEPEIHIKHKRHTDINKLFKPSRDTMDIIRQFITIFEFELICDAKRVEWDWNCRVHNCY